MILICTTVLLLCAPSGAQAAELSVGLGGAWVTSPYKEHDDIVLPMPLISYEGERFFIRGARAGMHIWKGDIQEVSVALSYFGLSFDPDKTDDRRLKKLDDRYSSVNADLLYNLRTDYGHLGLRLSHDILDNGDGFSAEFSYRYPYMFENICLTPSAGLRWDSEDQTGYYFGVSSKEARKSGLKEYSPNDAFSPYVALYANWEFTENWSLTLAEEVVFLSDEIRDSPMVNESQIFTTTIGLSYKF